ncbi:MAG: ROK family protein [Rikenellaceae bacterium]|nr:ROK family protein [Rikenellaceae bacterium]
MYTKDNRIVVTLDAGGTNFVFSAIQSNEYVIRPITLPSNASNLDNCLATLVKGFEAIIKSLGNSPVAISFAFPGPADYKNGIIGGYLPNFPSFRDGVALGPFLEDKFGLPVYINNDADLFTYGEALAGALPEINKRLREAGSHKQYNNLIGYTWGTGFGYGLSINGKLHIGDNSCTETFCLRHKLMPDIIVEDGVSIRAIKRVYGELAHNPDHNLEPVDIYRVATEAMAGDKMAAIKAFEMFGEIAGDAIATATSLVDGIVVIGGGITAASKFIIPSMLNEMRSELKTLGGESVGRLQMNVYNLDSKEEFEKFAKGESRELNVFGSDKKVIYDPEKRTGVMISKLGASKAIAIGAYCYALHNIDAK